MNTYRELKQKVDSRFLASAKKTDMRFYLLCLLALESGARVSDLLKLEWSNIDTENKIVIADIGHYESEQFTKTTIMEHLNKNFPNFAFISSKTDINPVHYF